MRYTELNETLKGRNATSKRYANNTYLHRRGDDIALQYHSTDVATFKANGDITLNSGGWFTSTTKERITWALANTQFGIYQEAGVWYIVKAIDGHWWNKANPRWRFADGMTLHTQADCVTGELPDTPKANKADRLLKSKVKAYAQLCADAVPLDKPSGADCWYCHLTTQNGDSLGDATKNIDHIDSHIKEGYIVPSLVYRALEQCYNAKMAFWQAFKDTGWTSDDREFGRQAVRKAVYRYILKRKGYAL